MSFEIKGLNQLMNRVADLERIDITQAVEETAKEVKDQLKSAASWSSRGSSCIDLIETRKYGPMTAYCKVGLKNTKAPWDEWKHLYFHNYGYHLKYFGHPTNRFITTHVLWFDNAAQGAVKSVKKSLRRRIRQQMRL